VRVRLRNALLVAALMATAAYLAWQSSSYWSGDYPVEAGPAIDSLIHGRLGDFLAERPLMGPLSLVLRAPFAALSLITGGGGKIDQYDAAYCLGVFPCALFGGALGLTLFAIAERLGRGPLVKYGALVLCAINPLTVKALTYGHPEEIVGGALLVGAMLAAIYQRAVTASILLAAAIATKQWAVLGAPAVLIVLPWEKVRRPLLGLAVLGALVLIPIVATDPASFVRSNIHLLDVRSGGTLPTSLWWLFTPGIGDELGIVHHTPDLIGLGAHPLIIALSVAVPLALRRQVSADVLTRALPVLAFVLLIRSALDPVSNSYYHLPFYLALIAADVMAGSLTPTLVATGFFVLIIDMPTHPAAQAWIYILCALAFAAHLVGRTCGRDWAALVRSRGARGRGVAQPAHSSSSAARS
jgi:hypothetical protein